jgi:hypothetical protein
MKRDRLAAVAHVAYERAALASGWETNPESRVRWEDVPESNKAATRAAVDAVLAELRARLEQRQFQHPQPLLCHECYEMAISKGSPAKTARCPEHGDDKCLREYVQIDDIRVELLGGDQDAE